MSQPLLVDRRNAVVIVSIHDAPYNRMSLAFMDELEKTVAALERDDSVRAVVLTGAAGRPRTARRRRKACLRERAAAR
jgi:enoyl-CoA hydratase